MARELVNINEMDDLRSQLDELLSLEDGLSGKEIEFLDSLIEWIGPFTVKQAEWLRKIYDNNL